MMIQFKQFLVIGIVSVLSGATDVRAVDVQFLFPLTPEQEVRDPPVVSPASGFADVRYDTDTNLIEWTINFQDLLAPVSGAHFHGPAAPGFNAGILVPMPNTPVTFGVLEGSATFPQQHEQALLDGLIYANIHSSTYPGGEIRGQVVPEPATLALLLAGAAGLFFRRPRR